MSSDTTTAAIVQSDEGEEVNDASLAAAVLALTHHGIPADIQELLIYGDPGLIKPGALQAALAAGLPPPPISAGLTRGKKVSERISASTRAREFLDSIVEGSPEQDSMLWFENAPYVVRLVAFIKLDVERIRLRKALQSISVQNSVKLIWKIAQEAINDEAGSTTTEWQPGDDETEEDEQIAGLLSLRDCLHVRASFSRDGAIEMARRVDGAIKSLREAKNDA